MEIFKRRLGLDGLEKWQKKKQVKNQPKNQLKKLPPKKVLRKVDNFRGKIEEGLLINY